MPHLRPRTEQQQDLATSTVVSEMLASLLVAFGKRRGQSLSVASDIGPIHSHLLHANDRISGTRFLMGTGAEVVLYLHL